MQKRFRMVVLAIAFVVSLAPPSSAPVRAQAPAAQSSARTERTVWYFYRVKWGFQAEFGDEDCAT